MTTLNTCMIDDKLSNKKSAIGIFNTILVAKVPTVIHQMAILASLTEIARRVEVELRLIRDTDDAVLFSGRGAVEDTRRVVEFVYRNLAAITRITATLDTHTRYNNTVDMGIYAAILDEGITQAGNALNYGKIELFNTYFAHEPTAVMDYSLWIALAGDPGLELFTHAIQFMTCAVPDQITLGVNTMTLNVSETGVGLDEA